MGFIIAVFYIIGIIYSCMLFVSYEDKGLVAVHKFGLPNLVIVCMLYGAGSWVSVVLVAVLANIRKFYR